MHCTRVIIPNRAHSNPRLKPLTSLITENFFFHWLKSSAKENRVDCAFAIRSTCRFQSSPCLRHSGPRSLFFFCLPTASLFWAFLLSVLISPKLFVLYPKYQPSIFLLLYHLILKRTAVLRIPFSVPYILNSISLTMSGVEVIAVVACVAASKTIHSPVINIWEIHN